MITKSSGEHHSFDFDAPTVWNDLPDEVRSAPTLACFRKRLKNHISSKRLSIQLKKIMSLQKGLAYNLQFISYNLYNLSGASMVLDFATTME